MSSTCVLVGKIYMCIMSSMNDDISSIVPAFPPSKTRWKICGVFFLILLIIYSKSLNNEFVRWDDGLLIYENPIVREISPTSVALAFSTYDPEL